MLNSNNLSKTAFLYPTMVCNLRCEICYSGAHKDIVKERLSQELTMEDYEEVISKLYTMGVRTFDLSGGEPFLCGFLVELIYLIKSYPDTQIYLVSNGTLIKENLSAIAKVIGFIDRFQISVDSANEEIHDEMRGVPGTFKKAVAGIKLLQSLEYNKIGINSVITSKNEDGVTELLSFAQINNLNRLQLLRLIDVAENGALLDHNVGQEKYIKLYETVCQWVEKNRNKKSEIVLHIEMVLPGYLMKQVIKSARCRTKKGDNVRLYVKYDPIHGCPSFKQAYVVTSYGEMTGCTGFVKNRDFYCSNIKTDETAQIETCFVQQVRLLQKREEYLKDAEPCKSCEAWNSCRGGCPATVSNYYDTVLNPDPTCMKYCHTTKS